MPFKISTIILTLTLLTGFTIRIIAIQDNPPGFFADEADIGYRAWQLVREKEISAYTNLMYMPAFGFYRPALPVWFTTIPVAMFGLNIFSVRLASVIVGTLAIWAVYAMTMSLTKRTPVALISAFLVAISPWHVHMSRVAFEGIYLTLFQTTGVWLLLKKNYYAGAAILGLSFYAYHPAILQSTGLFLGILLFILKEISWRQRGISVLIFLVTLIPFFHGIKTNISLSRLSQVSIAKNKDTDIKEKAGQFLGNYLAHFSHEFLFSKGDIGMPKQFITRHSIQDMGELYQWQSVFLLFGVISLLRRTSRTTLFLLLGWFFLYPFGSALTFDAGPQATRSIMGVIPFQVLTAIGVYWTYAQTTHFVNERFSGKQIILTVKIYIITLFTATIVFSTGMFLYRFFVQYPLYAADFWGWQFGARQVVSSFMSHATQYDAVYVQPEFNSPEIFFSFFDPETTCGNCHVGWMHEKINPNIRQLFAVTPAVFLKEREIIISRSGTLRTTGYVYYPDGTVAFLLVESLPRQ